MSLLDLMLFNDRSNSYFDTYILVQYFLFFFCKGNLKEGEESVVNENEGEEQIMETQHKIVELIGKNK